MVMNCHKIWSDIKLVPSCISFHHHQWPELEKKVVEWVEENRKSGLTVTRNLIRLHAKKTAQQMNIDNFLVSSGWCTPLLHEAEQTRAAPENEDDLVWEEEEDSSQEE